MVSIPFGGLPMRRMLLFAPCLLLLCSCSASSAADRIAPYYRSAAAIQARLAVTVDSGSYVSDYVLDWSYDGTTNVLTVAEPSQLSGVVLRSDPDGHTMTYDEAVLTLPDADGVLLSPLEMLAALFACWRDEYYESASPENRQGIDCVMLTWRLATDEMDSAELRTLFESESLLPLSCEYILGGVRRLTAQFQTISIT